MLDTQTGTGAYLIKGNLNGGEDDSCLNQKSISPTVSLIKQISFAVVLVMLLVIIIAIALPESIVIEGAVIGSTASTSSSLLGAVFAIFGLGALSLPVMAEPLQQTYLEPPGDCTVNQHASLQANVELKCNQSGTMRCTQGMPCNDISINITKAQACIDARELIVATCFRGIADPGHAQQILERKTGIRNCLCILNNGNCIP